jgi:anaphase-promoting complex subunit 2
MKHAKPALAMNKSSKSAKEDCEEIISVSLILRQAKRHYAYPVNVVQFPEVFKEAFERSFSALVRMILPFSVFSVKLRNFFEYHPLRELDAKGIEVYRGLIETGFDEEVELVLADLVLTELHTYIREAYSRQWEKPVFQDYVSWLDEVLIPCVETVLGRKEGVRDRLLESGANILVDLRIEELFDIVVDFPNSEPALRDLKLLLRKPSQRANTVSTFQQSCARRLLHNGANTVDIISGYIATMKSFHILDPRGILLDKVARPIRRYLKEREDTIGVLVCGLLGDETSEVSELADDLANTKSQENEKNVDDLLDMNWIPDPVDAPPDFIKKSSMDIVDSLINLYDSKEVFVKEFSVVLANRMLSQSISMEELVSILFPYH